MISEVSEPWLIDLKKREREREKLMNARVSYCSIELSSINHGIFFNILFVIRRFKT